MSFSARSNRDAASVSGRSSIKPLERRIPTNKKYENIKSSLDTGSSMNKVQYITQGQYIKRQSEIFYRVSPSDMYAMFTEYERHADENMAPGAYAGGGGAGGGPRIVVHEEEKTCERYEQPYLVLDVRAEADFAACHLVQARNFPQRLLMQDKSTAELHQFKNKEGKLIIKAWFCLKGLSPHTRFPKTYLFNLFALSQSQPKPKPESLPIKHSISILAI